MRNKGWTGALPQHFGIKISNSVIARCPKRGALSVAGETGGVFSSVRALPIPSPGWERARVRGIKKQIVTILFLSND
jgi:hypothetical protein